jgi:peptidoglycan hydrolase CwlO-like protein
MKEEIWQEAYETAKEEIKKLKQDIFSLNTYIVTLETILKNNPEYQDLERRLNNGL